MYYTNMTKPNKQQLAILRDVFYTKKHVLVMGSAGTGKTHTINIIRALCKTRKKALAVTATTGTAAHNIEGVTTCSFFNLTRATRGSYKKLMASMRDPKKRGMSSKARRIMATEIVVVDEVSMLTSDQFSRIQAIIKSMAPDTRPRLVLVGDPLQLPPVDNARETILCPKCDSQTTSCYESEVGSTRQITCSNTECNHTFAQPNAFFFQKDRLGATPFLPETFSVHVLKQNFRLANGTDVFAKTLDAIRSGNATEKDVELINSRATKEARRQVGDDCPTIVLTRARAAHINTKKFNELVKLTREKVYELSAVITVERGDDMSRPEREAFVQGLVRSPITLKICKGARVMCTENTSECHNGLIATVVKVTTSHIEILTENKARIRIPYHNTEVVKGKQAVSYTQFPLQLCYAMTIHKAQGLTLNRYMIENTDEHGIKQQCFCNAQLYTAISRSRSLNSFALTSPISLDDITVNSDALEFMSKFN
jgi:ATP-dependent DNA helicase PIF1